MNKLIITLIAFSLIVGGFWLVYNNQQINKQNAQNLLIYYQQNQVSQEKCDLGANQDLQNKLQGFLPYIQAQQYLNEYNTEVETCSNMYPVQ